MTKKQAELIIALLAAVLFAVMIIGASVLRGQWLMRSEIGRTMTIAAEAQREAEEARRASEAALSSSMGNADMLKRSTPAHAPIPLPGRRGNLIERGDTPAPDSRSLDVGPYVR